MFNSAWGAAGICSYRHDSAHLTRPQTVSASVIRVGDGSYKYVQLPKLRSPITTNQVCQLLYGMANRGKTLDPEVFSIADLQEKASKKLPKAHRGEGRADPPCKDLQLIMHRILQ